MISLVIFVALVAASTAQRPSFAGSSARGYPELASRFRGTESSNAPAPTEIGNRVGVDASSTTTTTTIRIPIDARGDQELVKRLQEWPRENQPFWLINAGHIEEQRNPDRVNQEAQQVQSRSGIEDDYVGGSRSPTPKPKRSTYVRSAYLH